MSLDINQIYQGFSQEKMLELEPGSVALSFWSPPYFVGKEYEKEETYSSWQNMLKKVIDNHKIVLKPGGFLVINIADILCFKDESIPRFQALNLSKQRTPVTKEMILKAKEEFPDYNRYQLAKMFNCSEQTIDRRLNGNNIRGGKHQTQTRVKLVGGMLEEFAYDSELYLYDRKIWVKDPAWANSRWTNNTLKAVDEFEYLYVFWKPGEYTIDKKVLSKEEWSSWGSRGIWNIGSVRKNDNHEAKFPLELAERVIRLYSKEGDLILDPFIGSGTTALAASSLKRNYIGIDKEEKYVLLSKNQIENKTKQFNLFS